MPGTVRVYPFEWPRFGRLREAFGAGDEAELVRLLAVGPTFRNREAARRWERVREDPRLPPVLRLELGFTAEPEAFALELARYLGAGPDDDGFLRDRFFVLASGADQEMELGAARETFWGLFSDAWLGGLFERGFPPVTAPDAVVAAFGGPASGVFLIEPEVAARLAIGLATVDVESLPPSPAGPWRDGLDPEGDLDDALRAGLRCLTDVYRRAAAAGWAIRVVS